MTTNPFQRRAIAFHNEQRSAAATLFGIARGLLADHQLQDSEIHFLNDWLRANETLSCEWPGSVITAKVREVLAAKNGSTATSAPKSNAPCNSSKKE